MECSWIVSAASKSEDGGELMTREGCAQVAENRKRKERMVSRVPGMLELRGES